MLERSAQAPPSWDVHDTEEAVRDLVLAADPDVVCLQELPGLVPFVETHDMIRSNPRTHSGNLATLVSHDLMGTRPIASTVAGCALLTTLTDPDLTVANVHLAPGSGPDARAARLDQLARIVEASPTPRLLIVGDTNTRLDEIDEIGHSGLGTVRPPRPTWDSRRNRFRGDSPAFTAYFTRWLAGPGLEVDDVRVWEGPLERDGRHFHVSDHYALSGVVRIPDVSA